MTYLIYRNKCLKKVIAEVPANQKLIFKDYKCKNGQKAVYSIVSVDAWGNTSSPAHIVIKNKYCFFLIAAYSLMTNYNALCIKYLR